MKFLTKIGAACLLVSLAHTASAGPVASEDSNGSLHRRNAEYFGNCGNFASGSYHMLGKLSSELADNNGACNVAARSCARVACRDTSALYLCNDNDFSISPLCKKVGNYMFDIIANCGGKASFFDSAMSGQLFTSEKWNMVMAYGNCGHSTNQRPDTYQGHGPNGAPSKQCTHCDPWVVSSQNGPD